MTNILHKRLIRHLRIFLFNSIFSYSRYGHFHCCIMRIICIMIISVRWHFVVRIMLVFHRPSYIVYWWSRWNFLLNHCLLHYDFLEVPRWMHRKSKFTLMLHSNFRKLLESICMRYFYVWSLSDSQKIRYNCSSDTFTKQDTLQNYLVLNQSPIMWAISHT